MYEVNRDITGPLVGTDSSAKPRTAAALSLDPRNLLGLARRRIGWIAGSVAVCLIAGLVFSMAVTPRYTSAAQILIDPTDLNIVENVIRSRSNYNDAHIALIESQVRIIQSDSVLRRVVEDHGLDRDEEFVARSRLDPRTLLPSLFGGDAETDDTLTALRELRRRVRTGRIERTYVVDVAVSTESREKSARLANGIVQAFFDDQQVASSEAARRASSALGGRLDELRSRVQEAEEEVERFKRANNILSAAGSLVNEQQVAELSSQLVQAEARRTEAQSRYHHVRELQANGADPGAVFEAIQSGTISNLRSEYAAAVQRESQLHTTFGPRHPAVVETRSQLDDLRGLIDEELERIAASLRNEYERAAANERLVADRLAALTGDLGRTNDAQVRLRELERDAEAHRKVYEDYLVRTREVTEQERIDPSNMRVISLAEPPRDKSWPPRAILVLAAAGMLGMAMGGALAVARELTDDRIWTAEALEDAAGVPVLATLGAASDGGQFVRLREMLRRSGETPGPQIVMMIGGDCCKSAAVQQFAIAVEEAGEPVLAVDADSRNGILTRMFGAEPGPALSEILRGSRGLDDMLPGHNRSTGPRLVPAAHPPPARSAIAQGDLRQAFGTTDAFDLVVIDGPLQPADAAGRGFAAIADDLVLVVPAGRTRRAEVADRVQLLNGCRHKLRGAVLCADLG
jgi:polysaccharide biosynthesis transport protein